MKNWKKQSIVIASHMKAVVILITAIGAFGLHLGHWLTLLVSSARIHDSTIYTGKSVTVTASIISRSFALGSGPGVAGVFLIPVFFLIAHVILIRRAQQHRVMFIAMIYVAAILILYGLVTWLVFANFPPLSPGKILSYKHQNHLSDLGIASLCGLAGGVIAIIFAWYKGGRERSRGAKNEPTGHQ